MKMLCLSTDLQQKIRRQCEDSYPREACGLLIGQGGGATKIIPSANISNHPEKNFEIDPVVIFHHHKKGRTGNDKIIGHYHSHPDADAWPSNYDQNQNYDPGLIWLIVKVTGGISQEMNAFVTSPVSGKLEPISLYLSS